MIVIIIIFGLVTHQIQYKTKQNKTKQNKTQNRNGFGVKPGAAMRANQQQKPLICATILSPKLPNWRMLFELSKNGPVWMRKLVLLCKSEK